LADLGEWHVGKYRPAKITLLATTGRRSVYHDRVVCVLCVAQPVAYKASDSAIQESFMSPEVWARMTDLENKRFRYVY